MTSYSQASRPVRIKSPLGDDAIHFLSLTGYEGISELFEFQIACRSSSAEPVAYDDLLGKEISLRIDIAGCPTRHLSGFVAELTELGRDATGISYQMRLVPALWTLSLGRRFRLFQQLTVPQILSKVLSGIETRFDLSAAYPKHNLCVQYDESDFIFASRLMEEEGIYYYFEHFANGHRMVLSDDSRNAPRLPESDEIQFGMEGLGEKLGGCIQQWRKAQRVTIGKSLQRDFCFERSATPIAGEATIVSDISIGKTMHHFSVGNALQRQEVCYPAGYVHRFDGISPSGADQSTELHNMDDDAQRVAKLRIEQKAAFAIDLRGTSDCGHFAPGFVFKLNGHYSGDGDYLLTRIEHQLTAPDFRSGDEHTWSYENTFRALPALLPYRPPLTTPRAVVRGTQTAVVLGIGDDPIRTDKYGRVKVRFHWDCDTVSGEVSSAWIRVAQNWAGNGWGMMNIPRANQEVVVDFLNGDPDCPIIIGSVYNQENMPPFELPGNKTFAGVKSDSQLSKNSADFSGLAFNDLDGQEEVHLRAQKDMVLFVKNNHLANVSGQNYEHTGSVRFVSVGGFPPRHHSGSGSGGGDSIGHKISEVAGWGWDEVKQGLGQSFTTNIGVDATKGVGKYSTAVYGGGQMQIVDPVAWSAEFFVPINSNFTYITGLVLGTGYSSLVYGKYVDRSFGARLRAHRGPLFEYAGSMMSGKFPTRVISGLQPVPTMVALITEEILKGVKKDNIDALVGLNAGVLVAEGVLGLISGVAERNLIRTLEASLKTDDGSEGALVNLGTMPSSFSKNTSDAMESIQSTNAEEAEKDLVFQSETKERRSAHRVLVDGPYSVKSAGMLELTTFQEMAAGGARLNLSNDTAVLAAVDLVSVLGNDSLIEVGVGVNVYGGPEGTVNIGAGVTANKEGAFARAQFAVANLTLSAGSSEVNPAQMIIAESSIKVQVGAPNACCITMDGTSITLGCGRNVLTINREGIQLTGNLIKLNAQSGIQHSTPLTQIQN